METAINPEAGITHFQRRLKYYSAQLDRVLADPKATNEQLAEAVNYYLAAMDLVRYFQSLIP
jgi:hypothetical protein